jgi:ABC-type lipoprotein release transport system permease subunit
MMSNFGFTNVVYPVLTADHVVTAASVITFITLVSSIYPSLRAVMIKPAEAIRK